MMISSIFRVAALCGAINAIQAWNSPVIPCTSTRISPGNPMRCGPIMAHGRGSYERAEDDTESIDVKRVESLLDERQELRRNRRYEDADIIRDRLNAMGVTIWDKERVWSCGGALPPCPSPASHVGIATKPGDWTCSECGASPIFASRTRCFRCGAARPMPGKARIGEAEHRNEFEKTRCFVENLDFDTEWPALKDHFLMAGYPVVYASVSSDRITGLSKGHGIVQFETVHAANHAMLHMTGSMLDGRTINIRPDYQEQNRRQGIPAEQVRATREESWRDSGTTISAAGGYARQMGDAGVVDVQLIESMLAERTALRKRKDFDGADSIRDELKALGVAVDDSKQTWYTMREKPVIQSKNARAHSLSKMKEPWMNKDWTRVAGSKDGKCSVNESEVLGRLKERDTAREKREYAMADAILDELNQMGIGLDDGRRQRCWWVGDRKDGKKNSAQGGSMANKGRRAWFRD